MHELAEILRTVPDLEVRENERMSAHTSFGIGGPADILVVPHTLKALQHLIKVCHDHEVQPVVLGNGTNVLVQDGGIRGVVIRLADNLGAIELSGNRVKAQAGAAIAAVCRFAADHGLSGLEFAAGIPGTVGGAAWMNAGANGGDMGSLITSVRGFRFDGSEVLLDRDELEFSYRHSSLQKTDLIIAEVELELVPDNPATIHARLCEGIETRCARQPVAQKSAGSIFKRPPGDYAGRLLEVCGAKGCTIGEACVSLKHANFIVNAGHATAEDVLKLINEIRRKVYEYSGIWLETEVLVLGEAAPKTTPAATAPQPAPQE